MLEKRLHRNSRAVYARDRESADVVHNGLMPLKAHSLGRHVRNFDARKWDEIAPDVMALAQYHKVMQNRLLHEALLGNKRQRNRLLWQIRYKGSHSRSWGRGVGIGQNPTDVTTWKGENIIGKILILLREHIPNIICFLWDKCDSCKR